MKVFYLSANFFNCLIRMDLFNFVLLIRCDLGKLIHRYSQTDLRNSVINVCIIEKITLQPKYVWPNQNWILKKYRLWTGMRGKILCLSNKIFLLMFLCSVLLCENWKFSCSQFFQIQINFSCFITEYNRFFMKIHKRKM